MASMTPEELMKAKREIDPQLDARNMLAALAQSNFSPQTSYAGLDPQLALAVGKHTSDVLGGQQQLVNQLYNTAITQDAQAYADAMKAHQMSLQYRDQALNEAVKGLQMQHVRQQMAQAAALHPLQLAQAQSQLEQENALKDLMIDTPYGRLPASLFKGKNSPLRLPNLPKEPARKKWEVDSENRGNFWNGLGVKEDSYTFSLDPQKARKDYNKHKENFLKAFREQFGADPTPEEMISIDDEISSMMGIAEPSVRRWLSGVSTFNEQGQPQSNAPQIQYDPKVDLRELWNTVRMVQERRQERRQGAK